MGFKTISVGSTPDLDEYQKLRFEEFLDGEQMVSQFTIEFDEGGLGDTYAWLTSVIDRIQLEDQTPGQAIQGAIASNRRIFDKDSRLSAEQEVGLFGELTMLHTLSSDVGMSDALQRWIGTGSCLLYTSPSPRDRQKSRMPSSA